MPLVIAALSYLVWACALPFLWLHPKMRGALLQRLGVYQALALPQETPMAPAPLRIMLHGASAGDVLALVPTARALRAAQPHCCVVLTTLTGSGITVAKLQGPLFDAVLLSPLDTPWTVNRCMRQLRPDVVVLEYTELWPQLIAGARRAGAHVALHNGRFGLKRLWRYRLLFALTGNLLQQLDLLLMRDPAQVDAARALGAAQERVVCTGNTKFDGLAGPSPTAAAEALRQAIGLQPQHPVLVCGSTHEGEEEQLLQTYVALRRKVPQLRLILAPRYANRSEALVKMCRQLGLSCGQRVPATAAATAPQVFVLNTVGELKACYLLADVVFVGGSFTRRGGQNILEPAALGKPVVFGPHMGNFADAVAALAGRGGVQVQDTAQLQRVLGDLLSDTPMRLQLGRIAQAQVRAVGGAAVRNAELLLGLLRKS